MEEIVLESGIPKVITLSYHVRCPCKIKSYETPLLDSEFLIPITENDTPASIAEAIVNKIQGVTVVDVFNGLNDDIEEE